MRGTRSERKSLLKVALHKPEGIVFRRWSNKKWAVFSTLHKVIAIATLCYSSQILGQQVNENRSDSSHITTMILLEEVEAIEEMPAELADATLRPLLKVTSRDISQSAATAVEDLLEFLPQVDIRQRGKHGVQADLNIQGGTFDQSMVLLNGINISDPQTGHFQLNLPLDIHALSSMEVITGSAARVFGTNAFSGALNLITMPADSLFYQAGLKYGQHNFYQGHLNINLSSKNISTLVSLGTSGSDGYRKNTDFQTKNAFIHSIAGRKKLKIHTMLGLNERNFGANAFYSPNFTNQYEETATGLAALKFEWKAIKTAYVFDAYFRQNRDYFLLDRFDPVFYNNNHRTQAGGLDLNARFSHHAGITYTGIHYRLENIQSTSLGELITPGEEIVFNDSITFTHAHLRNGINANLNHTFTWKQLIISGGAMLHLNSDLDNIPGFFPGIDLRWALPSNYRVYFSVNRSLRLPTFTDLYYQGPTNVGNPNLLPEKALLYELGVFRKDDNWYLGLNGFYRQGKDLIDWIWMEDDRWHTMNFTRVDALGGDFRIAYHKKKTFAGIIDIEEAHLSYTYTQLTKVSDNVNSRYLLDNLKQKLVGGGRLRITQNILFSLQASAQERNGGYLAYDPETGTSLEQAYNPFFLLDAKLTFILNRLQFTFEVSNILDARYNDIGNVIQPGRWIIGGIAIK